MIKTCKFRFLKSCDVLADKLGVCGRHVGPHRVVPWQLGPFFGEVLARSQVVDWPLSVYHVDGRMLQLRRWHLVEPRVRLDQGPYSLPAWTNDDVVVLAVEAECSLLLHSLRVLTSLFLGGLLSNRGASELERATVRL